MRNFIKQNPWFVAGLVTTVFLGLLLVYLLGFWGMVMKFNPNPERLRNITFPIWDQHSFFEHGYLVFYSLSDFEKGIAYPGHSSAYLFFMYVFYKLEMAIPRLPMKAIVATFEMIFCILAIVYVALPDLKERVKFHRGLLILLAVMFLLTMPIFWISAGKFNVDNPFHFLFPMLLVVAHRISQDAEGVKLWLPLGALCVAAPFAAALLGTYLVVFSIGNNSLSKKTLKLGGAVTLIGVVVFLQPIFTAKVLGFATNNSGWGFRSGLDGDTSYFKNVLQSIFSPYNPRPLQLLALPAGLLLAQLAYIAIRTRASGEDKVLPVGSNNPRLFYGLLFSQYLISCLLWPQAVSIHPYLYDYMLLAPICVWIVFNFVQSRIFLRNPQIFIWIMLFFISFNLQQIAQANVL